MGKNVVETGNNEVPVQVKKGKTTLVSAAIYHNFEENPLFKGTFLKEIYNEEGKMIGYLFVNTDGEEEVIPNNHAIEKALNTVTENGQVRDLGKMLEIEFHGKTVLKSTGKPYSRFQIFLID